MSVIDFPTSPSVGQQFDNWTWDGVKWVGNSPQGPAGFNAFSFVLTAFTVPLVGQLVSINVVQANWAQPGLCIFVGGMYGIIQTSTLSSLIVVRLSEDPDTDSDINGAVVPPGTLVSPSGFPGIGVPGPAGSNETSVWIALNPAPGWNSVGWTVMCRTQLNLQTLQFRGQGSTTSPIIAQSTLTTLPAGIPWPVNNRVVPVTVGTSMAPGYSTASVVVTPTGNVIVLPVYPVPTTGISSVSMDIMIALDNGPT